MGKERRIRPRLASPVLLLLVAASVVGIVYARSSSNVTVQVLTMLVSTAIAFFASHPLGHQLWARAYGVNTQYFFRRQERLPETALEVRGGRRWTHAHDRNEAKKEELAELSPLKRGYVFEAGVIVSTALIGIELLYVLVAGFSLPACS